MGATAMSDLPAGFVLDQQQQTGGLPTGFVMDSPGIGATALDAVKQLGSGAAVGVENMPGAMPSLINMTAQGLGPLVEKYAPWLATANPAEEAQRQSIMQQGQKVRADTSVANYLPQPQTKVGEAARTVGEFMPSAMAMSGGLAKNAVSGVGAGLGAFGGSQIAQDDASRPYLSAAGALVGGAAGLKAAEGVAARSARNAVTSAQDIKDAATQSYDAIRQGAVGRPITQNTLDIVADDMKRALNAAGQRPSTMGAIHNAIDEIRTPGTEGKADLADLVAGRQSIKEFFKNPMPDPNKAGAVTALGRIDAAIGQLSPDTLSALREADRNYSAASTAATLDKRIARAELRANGEHSGMNLGNKIRQNAANMLLSNKESRGLTDFEKSGLETVNKGTTLQNATRFASNLLGGGGGLGSAIVGGGALAGGYETGHPELAALPLLGFGLRGLSNRSIANQANNVSAAIRARSPFAQSLGVTAPAPRMSDKQLAALSALYAMPSMRGILSPALTNN